MKINNTLINFKARKIPKKQAKQIENALKKSSKIDIICHESTDSDAANSAVAMRDYLKPYGINSRIIISHQDLKTLHLEKEKNIIQAHKLKDKENPETVLCVDFSAKERISPKVLKHIKKAKQVICIDHHEGSNLQDSVKQNYFYIDTSAKSATSIIYRLFEARNKEITKKTAYNLFYGLISDCNKRGFVHCDGIRGTITPCDSFKENKEAFEIYTALKEKLSDEEISDIARKIDITSGLTKEEKKFSNSLHEKIKFSKNKKIAYVVIPPDDKIWKSLGEDNTRTSAILNKFRQSILNSKEEKYTTVKTVITFYKASDKYRMSIHSKEETLDKFYEYLKKQIKNPTFSAGGHKKRGGGSINITNIKNCILWANEVIKYADFYD